MTGALLYCYFACYVCPCVAWQGCPCVAWQIFLISLEKIDIHTHVHTRTRTRMLYTRVTAHADAEYGPYSRDASQGSSSTTPRGVCGASYTCTLSDGATRPVRIVSSDGGTQKGFIPTVGGEWSPESGVGAGITCKTGPKGLISVEGLRMLHACDLHIRGKGQRCKTGQTLTSSEECVDAKKALGFHGEMFSVWHGSVTFGGMPPGCIRRTFTQIVAGSLDHWYFNTARGKPDHPEYESICFSAGGFAFLPVPCWYVNSTQVRILTHPPQRPREGC